MRPPQLAPQDGRALGSAGALLPRSGQDAIREAFEIERSGPRGERLADGLPLGGDQRHPVAAGRAAAQVLLDPGAVVVRQDAVEQRPEERHDVLAALHSSSSSRLPASGASSPRYSRSLFCIFKRAWNRRLITVPLRMARTFDSSSYLSPSSSRSSRMARWFSDRPPSACSILAFSSALSACRCVPPSATQGAAM